MPQFIVFDPKRKPTARFLNILNHKKFYTVKSAAKRFNTYEQAKAEAEEFEKIVSIEK